MNREDQEIRELWHHLEARIGYVFRDPSLLETAMTHSTYAYEHRSLHLISNERLEFVGDGILDFLVAETLYRRAPEHDEGYLSKTRALIVCEATLSSIAVDIGLGDCLLMGRGETMTGGREKPSNLSNAMEALFAACYYDGGFDAAKGLVLRLMFAPIEEALSGELIFDYKSRLLEIVQAKGSTHTARFAIVSEDGPVHEREYTAAVFIDDMEVSSGKGLSKKQAEQEAAKIWYSSHKKGFS
jgi:ribonuclease III